MSQEKDKPKSVETAIEVAAQPTPNPSLQSSISRDGVLYQNTKETLILVTQDKLELAFQKHAPRYSRRLGWAVPFGALLAFATALVTTDFKHEVLSANAWKILFVVGAIASFLWLVREVYQSVRTPRRSDVTNKFIVEAKGDSDKGVPIKFV